MTRYIAFSLYGDKPLYIRGMVMNLGLAPNIYKGWKVIVYASPMAVRALELHQPLPGPCIIELQPEPLGHEAMLWRFEATQRPDADHVIFRDADSRLNVREAAAVAEWVASGVAAHVMRDHPHHANWPMLGGMWGVRAAAIPDLVSLMAPWFGQINKMSDQRFLALNIWPRIVNNMVHHSSVPTPHPFARPFPPHPQYEGFVGQVVDPDGEVGLDPLK
jgi:hypothetical protein